MKGYNYSQEGLYFITICIKDRECLFGKIENNEMILNAIGEMANCYWLDISIHFTNVVLHKHIIMPNHIHGIIELVGTRHGVSLRYNPINTVGTSHGMSHGVSQNAFSQQQSGSNQFGKPVPGSIPVIINQYKSSVKRWCNKNNFRDFQWQSRFYDHIIRSQDDYTRISDYIINNPIRWRGDKFYQHEP
jgi:putative transposase